MTPQDHFLRISYEWRFLFGGSCSSLAGDWTLDGKAIWWKRISWKKICMRDVCRMGHWIRALWCMVFRRRGFRRRGFRRRRLWGRWFWRGGVTRLSSRLPLASAFPIIAPEGMNCVVKLIRTIHGWAGIKALSPKWLRSLSTTALKVGWIFRLRAGGKLIGRFFVCVAIDAPPFRRAIVLWVWILAHCKICRLHVYLPWSWVSEITYLKTGKTWGRVLFFVVAFLGIRVVVSGWVRADRFLSAHHTQSPTFIWCRNGPTSDQKINNVQPTTQPPEPCLIIVLLYKSLDNHAI